MKTMDPHKFLFRIQRRITFLSLKCTCWILSWYLVVPQILKSFSCYLLHLWLVRLFHSFPVNNCEMETCMWTDFCTSIYIYTHTYVCVYMCTLVFYQIQDDYVRCVLSPNPVLVGEGNVLLYFFSVLASFCQLSLYLITLYALSLIISQSSCPLPQPTLCPLLCSMGPMLL